jgi:hypothetical protein
LLLSVWRTIMLSRASREMNIAAEAEVPDAAELTTAKNGQVERLNRMIKDVTVRRFYYDARSEPLNRGEQPSWTVQAWALWGGGEGTGRWWRNPTLTNG